MDQPIEYSPKEEDRYVSALLDQLDVEFGPEIIPIMPEPYAKLSNCYVNVEEKVKRNGGNAYYGWAVLRSDIICEAERHAVWENEEGELIDITPRIQGWKELMFIPDNDFVYEGQLVDNVRINTTPLSSVDDFIALCEAIEELYGYGERVSDEQVEVPSPGKEVLELYETLKVLYLIFIRKGGEGHRACFCDSGKPYRKCHGKPFITQMSKDMVWLREQLRK